MPLAPENAAPYPTGETATYPIRSGDPLDDDPDTPLGTASWNAVAVASVAWQQSTGALQHILQLAAGYGLTRDELSVASGLPCNVVDQMLEEVD